MAHFTAVQIGETRIEFDAIVYTNKTQIAVRVKRNDEMVEGSVEDSELSAEALAALETLATELRTLVAGAP